MKYSYLNARSVALLLLVIPSLLLMNSGVVAHTSPIQDADKTLDIERYPDEPLELVELKIGDQPIKDKIATKWRHDDSFGNEPDPWTLLNEHSFSIIGHPQSVGNER
jgi:hypothetical protein